MRSFRLLGCTRRENRHVCPRLQERSQENPLLAVYHSYQLAQHVALRRTLCGCLSVLMLLPMDPVLCSLVVQAYATATAVQYSDVLRGKMYAVSQSSRSLCLCRVLHITQQPRLSSVLRLAQAPDGPVFDLDKEVIDREK